MASPDAPFDFYDAERPIYTHARFLPGAVINGAELHNVLLADGSRIGKAEIEEAVIGLRSIIADGVSLRNSIIMGADYYDPPEGPMEGPLPLGIGAGSAIEGAIIDKNARIGKEVVIKPFPLGTELDTKTYSVRDGIVVVPKGRVIPDGTYIGP